MPTVKKYHIAVIRIFLTGKELLTKADVFGCLAANKALELRIAFAIRWNFPL